MPDYTGNNPGIASNVAKGDLEYIDGMVFMNPKRRRKNIEDVNELDNIKDVDMGLEEGNRPKKRDRGKCCWASLPKTMSVLS